MSSNEGSMSLARLEKMLNSKRKSIPFKDQYKSKKRNVVKQRYTTDNSNSLSKSSSRQNLDPEAYLWR